MRRSLGQPALFEQGDQRDRVVLRPGPAFAHSLQSREDGELLQHQLVEDEFVWVPTTRDNSGSFPCLMLCDGLGIGAFGKQVFELAGAEFALELPLANRVVSEPKTACGCGPSGDAIHAVAPRGREPSIRPHAGGANGASNDVLDRRHGEQNARSAGMHQGANVPSLARWNLLCFQRCVQFCLGDISAVLAVSSNSRLTGMGAMRHFEIRLSPYRGMWPRFRCHTRTCRIAANDPELPLTGTCEDRLLGASRQPCVRLQSANTGTSRPMQNAP